MASQLKNILRFAGVAPMANSVLPHGLNVSGVAVAPDVVTPSGSDFTVTADATNITVTNNGLAAASVDVLAEHWHTIERVFGAHAVTDLVPQPFVASGAGAGASNDEQAFRYTAGGGDGSDFNVALPAARDTDDYIITAALSDAAAIYGMRFPNALAGDRTTAQFRVITTAAVTAGDVIEFRVTNLV